MIYPVYLLIVGNTLHVCECKSATFPWRLPPNTVGVGFAVIYKHGTMLRNIVQKKPSENHTAFYDGRITVNYSRAMTLTGVIPTDTGKYTFFTVPSDADDSDIELYVHDSHVKTFYLLKIIFNYYSKYVLIEARQLVGEPHIQQYLFLFTDCPLEEDNMILWQCHGRAQVNTYSFDTVFMFMCHLILCSCSCVRADDMYRVILNII